MADFKSSPGNQDITLVSVIGICGLSSFIHFADIWVLDVMSNSCILDIGGVV